MDYVKDMVQGDSGPASNTANDVNNFSAFNGDILEGVTVLPDELRSFKDEKIIWLTVK
ncbi:hypothetical protein RO3G_16801 [Rhizopus delemar RA 99-880]|uniref:Uncharacterized protein n=1 Tax=Rhizopus delemar (strain RA 99-880 / ATCC MYA-4621 / FGSC 9543 / NRRL 43880) TaxID=246409 RepID=I1CUG0_RHIO9|nr:hypothetical protein RO3G_16801 [Rhizopus delemar RA 99-880]|eukprot:EIE92090.1 hypothetical protein RO3G_16801 [Rhizopus delemar RA 99-880]